MKLPVSLCLCVGYIIVSVSYSAGGAVSDASS